MSDPNFTDDDVLMAADRFEVEHNQHGTRMRIADDWWEPGKHLSTVEDCRRYGRTSLERGLKITIKARHGYQGIPEAAS